MSQDPRLGKGNREFQPEGEDNQVQFPALLSSLSWPHTLLTVPGPWPGPQHSKGTFWHTGTRGQDRSVPRQSPAGDGYSLEQQRRDPGGATGSVPTPKQEQRPRHQVMTPKALLGWHLKKALQRQRVRPSQLTGFVSPSLLQQRCARTVSLCHPRVTRRDHRDTGTGESRQSHCSRGGRSHRGGSGSSRSCAGFSPFPNLSAAR